MAATPAKHNIERVFKKSPTDCGHGPGASPGRATSSVGKVEHAKMKSKVARSGSPARCARTRLCWQRTERPASKSLPVESRRQVGTAAAGLPFVFRRRLGKTSTYNIHDSQAGHPSKRLFSLDFQPRRPNMVHSDKLGTPYHLATTMRRSKRELAQAGSAK